MNYKRFVVGLCLAAGILYNSWPLGYVLDSATARHGLASNLEVVGHPYYWLFILGDVLTAVCMLAVAGILRFRLWQFLRSHAWAVVAAGLLLFGLFTTASAFLPSRCTITPVLRCGANRGDGFGLDALTSSIAMFGLLLSLVCLSLSRGSSFGARTLLLVTRTVLIAWVASGLLFVVLAVTNGTADFFSQDILMILTGLALFVVGLNISAGLDT